MRFWIVGLIFVQVLVVAPAKSVQTADESIFDRIRREHQQIEKESCRHMFGDPGRSSGLVSAAQPGTRQAIDVQHYRLQISLDPERSAISGTVSIDGVASSLVATIAVDAADNLSIDGVRANEQSLQFTRSDGRLSIGLPQPLSSGKAFNLKIDYHGTAVTVGRLGGGMLVQRHGPDSRIVMANLSEPFAAPTWWPCIDDPRDKATIEVEATAPSDFKVASNGVLVSTHVNSDQTATYIWREDYQIATYLVSVAATNYTLFEDSYTALDGITKMPLVYYVYPEHLDLARIKFGVTPRAIEIFASLFGEYPFVTEKYGMAEFPWSGAMEHQTMTSMGQNIVGSVSNSGQTTIVHELGHQWWGDLVTMNTWDDIWLNEGFATYCEVLFNEHYLGLQPGELMSRSYDDGLVFGSLGGTVTAERADDPFDDRGAIYSKGGWVLHMLRHVVGEQKFFEALRDYRATHEFATASSTDLRLAFERAYGQPLDWFFQQWVYAPGRPSYKVSTAIDGPDVSGQYDVQLTIKQKQSVVIPGRDSSVFIMPLDVTLHYEDGSRETRVILNDSRKQRFHLSSARRPVSIGIDEDHWVLKKVKGAG